MGATCSNNEVIKEEEPAMSARLLHGDVGPVDDQSFLDLTIASLQDNADKTLILDTGTDEAHTFGEVHSKASAISEKLLLELGIGEGDIVLMVSNYTPEALIFSLGVWFSGASNSPVNPALPIDEIRMFIETTKSRVIYVGEDYTKKVTEAVEGLGRDITLIAPNGEEPILNLNEITEHPAALVTSVDQPAGKDHCLIVLFTSGTTGIPKGVRCRDETIQFNSSMVGGQMNIDWKTPLASSPLYWISNTISWTMCLKTGSTLHLADRPSPRRLLEVITKYKPEVWFTGPSALIDMSLLPDVERYDLSSLKTVMVGGALLFPDQRRQIGERLFGGRSILRITYGSTEGGMVTIEKEPSDPGSPRFGSIGQPFNNITLKVVNPDTGDLMAPYQLGEICVKSPAVIKSYINKELTESDIDGDGFWHMGDLGYYDEGDFVFYMSRIKDVMKYRGQQIAPAELEDVIHKHPDVLESAVVGKPSPEYGELPAAFVVLNPGSSLTEEELFHFVAEHVIDEKKLRGGIYFIESLPRSAVGKILRRELVKILND